MNFKISIHGNNELIPQVINGTSANTMFWFINHENLQNIESYENTNFPSLPYDLDDFGRCILAANVFHYSESDIQKGLDNIKKLNQSEKFTNFFRKFLSLKKEFETGKTQVVRNYLEKLNDD